MIRKKRYKGLSDEEHIELYSEVQDIGFASYMYHEEPDFNALARLGFPKKVVVSLIKGLEEIERAINEAEKIHLLDDERVGW